MKLNYLKSLIWLFVAILLTLAVQVPMLWQGNYLFLLPNSLTILLSVLYIRNGLDFKNIEWHKNKWLRYVVFVLNIFLFIFILNRLELFLGYVDSMSIESILKIKNYENFNLIEMLQYIHNEYLLFSIASFLAIVFYNIKLFTSFWNRSKLKSERPL
ncbi:MAG: hypothetical protein H6579_10080 [Chitinophagales bacterium]|nr:hypothetical protein [Chitinophagales bacterium]